MDSHSKENHDCANCGYAKKKENFLDFCKDCFIDLQLKVELKNKDHAVKHLEELLEYFVSDVSAAFNKDPAAKSIIEIFTSYPGVQAVMLYRVAHLLIDMGIPFIPRYLSGIAKQLTGIDIHPGAIIGKNFFIDHGTGVVIGETTEVGDNVTLYQGVTLGGTSLEAIKRHPTLGNNIIVGAGAKVLGPITIGDNVKIGANSVVTQDIPANSVVVGVPGRIVKGDKELVDDIKHLLHGKLPDPMIKLIERLESRVSELEEQISKVSEEKEEKKNGKI